MTSGIVVGVLAVAGLIRLVKREEPTGCVIVLGTLIFLLFLAILLVPQLVLAG